MSVRAHSATISNFDRCSRHEADRHRRRRDEYRCRAGGRRQVVAAVKAPTTADVTGGISRPADAARRFGRRCGDRRLLVGTTHFVNAVRAAPALAQGCGDSCRRRRPRWRCRRSAIGREDLARLVNGGAWAIEGGHDYDGRRFMPLNVAGRQAAREIRERGLRHAAVSAMFSPLDVSGEERVATILRDEIPGIEVTCSHLLGGIGLLERENAALVNASLMARPRHRQGIRGCDARQRRRCAALHHTERRHGCGRGTGRAIARLQLCLGSHQFDARRRLPLRCKGQSLSTSAERRRISAISSAVSRARPIRSCILAESVRYFACPISFRSGSAAAVSSMPSA